jgi:hypothetical protein
VTTVLPGDAPAAAVRAPGRPVAAVAGVAAVAVLATGGYLLGRGHTTSPGALPARPPATAPARGSAQSELSAALAAAAGQGWMHSTVRATTPQRTLTATTASGPGRGVQHVRIGGAGSASVRVLGRHTYFTAGRAVLESYFDFQPGLAARYAGHWIGLAPGAPGYAGVTSGVTMHSALATLRSVSGPLHLVGHRIVDGTAAVGIGGAVTGDGVPAGSTATLWVSAHDRPLPVEYVEQRPGEGRDVVRFSGWGRSVPVVTPAEDRAATS